MRAPVRHWWKSPIFVPGGGRIGVFIDARRRRRGLPWRPWLRTDILRVGALAASPGRARSCSQRCSNPSAATRSRPTFAWSPAARSGTTDRLLDLDRPLPDGRRRSPSSRGRSTRLPGRDWARVGQPFLVLMGALGAGAVLAGRQPEGDRRLLGRGDARRQAVLRRPPSTPRPTGPTRSSSARSWRWASTSRRSRRRS